MNSSDIEKLQRGIELKISSNLIQESLRTGSVFRKLSVHDINNLKYSTTNRVDIMFSDGATLLIHHVESHGFITAYRCDAVPENLDRLLFTNPSLMDRNKRFLELVLIDAT